MKKNLKQKFLLLLLAYIFLLVGCTNSNASDMAASQENESEDSAVSSETVSDVSGQLKVHYLDVGKADAILVQQGDHAMLIDGGDTDDAQLVSDYLTSQGVSQLDVVIGTHPHEDHIGGLSAIINQFPITTFYMSDVANESESTLADVTNAASEKGLTITYPEIGQQFSLGDAVCTVLGPLGAVAGNINSYSIVLRVDFGDTSFLFAGDAQTVNETAMIEAGENLQADVLKVGHHGSSSATSQDFLEAVDPTYAVISVGEESIYGFPASATLERLEDRYIELYRTDWDGTVVATSDGATITFN